METSKIQKPLWISHRGYHKYYTENTVEAFRESQKKGFLAIETDLRMTKDQHVVLCHDSSLQRLTGQEILVENVTRSELSQFQLPHGGRFLFFEQFCEEFKDMIWTLDIKTEHAPAIIEKVVEIGKKFNLSERIEREKKFLVWNKAHEVVLRTYYKEATVYARPSECWKAGLSTAFFLHGLAPIQKNRIYSLVANFAGLPLFQQRVVEHYQTKGAKVLAYLPQKKEDVLKALQAGFDEILTNEEPED